ncbi:MAG: lipoprotein [Chitinophagaceae bacterium]|nr:lipoprotein [Chitinophagaceae bacterium]
MKKTLLFLFATYILSGCAILKGKEKLGCPTDGKNIGAEKIASGDPAAIKAAKKAKKFKY